MSRETPSIAAGYPPTQSNDPFKILQETTDFLLTQKPSIELREKIVDDSLQAVAEILERKGWKYFTEIQDLYNSFLNYDGLLVRRENPLKFLEAVANNKPLEISFETSAVDVAGEKYANCAEWTSDGKGLANAFLEGYSSLGNNIVFVVGFKSGADLKVTDIPADRKFFHNLDRTLVRSVEGRVNPSELKFVVLRVPAAFFPKDKMTEKELERWEEEQEKSPQKRTMQIFRGFVAQ